MRQMILLFSCLAGSLWLSAQTISFSDDFEAYNVGDYIGDNSSDWTTWSGTTGSTEDVQVVDNNANGGSNSIYFFTTNGGPEDVVLPFSGAPYDLGTFHFEMAVFVEAASEAYFNFQANPTVGEIWAMEVVIDGDGISMYNTNGSLMTSSFPLGQWVTLEYDVNLATNTWVVSTDGNEIGSFSNTINQVSSLNVYPVVNSAANSSFWIDDVSYSFTPMQVLVKNAAVTAVSNTGTLAGQTKRPVLTMRNLGGEDITSFDLSIEYNGSTINESVTGVTVSSLDEFDIEFTQSIQLIAGSNDLVATISNVNGEGADNDPSDDVKTINMDPLVPAADKKVLVEEATGTWCGWCPRGTVAMANMQAAYPEHFIGVAVHNGDPMTNDEYDGGIGGLISGYPSAVVDRGSDIDPSVMEADFIQRIVEAPAGVLDVEMEMMGDSAATIRVFVELKESISSSWRVAAILTEDSVNGTGSNWSQANYYSGGGQGELTGAGVEWHNAPGNVSGLNYDHVGRGIYPGFSGMANAFPAMTAAGDTFSFSWEIMVDDEWNLDFMHVAAVLIDDAGDIDNANTGHILTNDTATGIASTPQQTMLVYPNPTQDQLTIETVLTNGGQLSVRDMMGRIVKEQSLNGAGEVRLTVSVSDLPGGVYYVTVQSGETLETVSILKQ